MSFHGGNIHSYLNSKSKFIDFSANINPLGFPDYIPNLICKLVKNIVHYPEEDSFSFREKIAKYHNIHPDNIIVGNGACELIHLLPKVFKPSLASLLCPSFSEYETALKISGAKINFISNWDKKKKSDFIFFNNPHNPLAKVFNKNYILSLLENYKILVVDESFIDFLPDNYKYSLIRESTSFDNIIVIRSLTKFFALPGLRLGYLVTSKKNIKNIKKSFYPWNVNYLAGKIGEEILFDDVFREKTHLFITKEKDYLYKNLSNIKEIKCFESSVNFFLIKILLKDVSALEGYLLKNNILIRNCSNFRKLDNTFFRIAVRTRKENKALLKFIKKFFKN